MLSLLNQLTVSRTDLTVIVNTCVIVQTVRILSSAAQSTGCLAYDCRPIYHIIGVSLLIERRRIGDCNLSKSCLLMNN